MRSRALTATVVTIPLAMAILGVWVWRCRSEGPGDAAPSVAPGGHAPLRRPREARKAEPPQGMVFVPPGTARLGTAEEASAALTEGRDAETKRLLAFEAPAHERAMPGYFLDAAEVTNAQYLVFLRDACLSFVEVVEGGPSDLRGLAGEALGTPPDLRGRDDHAWRVLYHENRNALWEVLPDRVVRRADGTVDEAATEEGFADAALRPGVKLLAYRRPAPRDWPGSGLRPQDAALPVRWVSFDDAEAFAQWAGKHVPSEAEWEYACRGPEGRVYPWGDAWDAARARHGRTPEASLPRLAPAVPGEAGDPLGEGRSWVGAWHLIGNVAEWTSSWFEAYPGAPADLLHPNSGTYVKVIRGGSLLDQDLLTLRGAARNFVGRGPEAPPLPQNRFEWVGFRCAKYLDPGQDLALPTIRRLLRGRVVAEDAFDLEGVEGLLAPRYAPRGTPAAEGVTVLGRCTGFVVVPLRRIQPDTSEGPPAGVERRLRDLGEREEVLFAGLHADLPLGGEGAKQRGLEGDWRSGSFFLGMHRGRLALLDAEREPALYLSEAGGDPGIAVHARGPDESLPDTVLRLDAERDQLELDVSVPVAAGERSSTYVRIRRRLLVWPGAAMQAGPWETR